MDFGAVYHFLFETMPGIAALIGGCLVLSIIICVIWERRTRKLYRDRPAEEDEWSMFDDDEQEEN